MDSTVRYTCLDETCVEVKSLGEDCKYFKGILAQEFLRGDAYKVVEEAGYEIFVHSIRPIKFVRVANGKVENLFFNLDYEDKESILKLSKDEEIVLQNDVCEFGEDFEHLDLDEIEFIKNLIRKHRDLIEEKFLQIR